MFKEEKIPLNSPISFDRFMELLKEQKLYITLYTSKMETCFIDKLEEVWNNAGTSTRVDDVDVSLLEDEEDSTVQLDDFLGLSGETMIDGLVSPFISKQVADKLVSLRLPNDSGYEVVRMEVYPYNQVRIFKI